MKSYRIGVDRLIAWHIVSDGVPYNLAGKNLTFKVSHPRGGFTVPSDGFTISGNVILWTFYGKDQKLLGPYSLTLIENEGQENMLSFDACNAFAFVSCTCQEGGVENPDLQLSGIDVETDLATIGIKLVVPVIGDNGNWFIGGVDTGHPVGGGSNCDCDLTEALSGKQDKIADLTESSWAAVLTEAGKVSGKQDAIVGLNQRNWDDTASKAATALQSETYRGTVTGVKMNGATKNPSNGVVDLGTVITAHQDISGKQDKISDLETIRSNAANAIAQLQTILGPDATPAIDRFNEIISFLEGIEEGDEGNLAAIIASIEQQIGGKQDAIVGLNQQNWNNTASKAELDKKAALDSAPTFTGAVTALAFYESSDETLKDFGEDIKVDFEKLKALPKKYFTWKSGGEKQIGTSAQEVQKLFPEIVGKREDGTLTVDYGKLSMVALKAVDELYEKNKDLEERILSLEALILK